MLECLGKGTRPLLEFDHIFIGKAVIVKKFAATARKSQERLTDVKRFVAITLVLRIIENVGI
ncbi:hypothetical protein EBQ90_12940 [bacterium]|nr:hypothetical protein [bacterium]